MHYKWLASESLMHKKKILKIKSFEGEKQVGKELTINE